jgi:hypothetical protein
MAKKKYLLLKGRLFVAKRNTDGSPKALRDVGECPLMKVMVEAEFLDNQPTDKPVQGTDLHVLFGLKVSGSMQVKEATKDNLALMSFGTVVEQTTATITARAFPSGIVAGETYQLPGGLANVSAVTIVDSQVTPATLVEGTDFTIDKVFGTITFISVAGKTQPFKISCTAGATSDVAIATGAPEELFLLLKGTNIGEGNKPVLLELYDVACEPAKELPGKTNAKEVGAYEIAFQAVEDEEKGTDPVLGSYGRYRLNFG